MAQDAADATGIASYQVRIIEPYHYTLNLRSGHTFPAAAHSRSGGTIIAYFVADPQYPWWYVVDVFGLRNAEVIAMDESYAVFAHPRDWLIAQRLPY